MKRKKTVAVLLLSLITLTACQSESPTRSNVGSLDNLALPGSESPAATNTSSAKPVILEPSTPASSAPQIKSPRVSNTWAYEVKKAGAPTSYLVGTVHAPLADNYAIPTVLIDKLSQSKALYLETDVDAMDKIMTQVVSQVINTQQDLESLLGTESWSKLLARFKELNISIQDKILRFFRPWYINILLSSIPNAEPVKLESIMDLQLRSKALNGKIPLRYLESPAEQISALQAIGEEEYLRLIKQNLSEGVAQQVKDRDRIFAIYNSLNMAELEKAVTEAQAESQVYFENMVRLRNQKWLNLLKAELPTQSLVIAVGALHLAGPDGLVAQLKAQGFEVQPLAF